LLDAQSVHKDLVEHYTKPTKAPIDKSNLLQYITTTCIGDGTYKGSTHGLILHCQDCLQKYESLVDTTDHLSDPSKTVMLQNAVHPLEELCTVKPSAYHNCAITGKLITYEEYSKLLCSAAISYNAQFSKHKSFQLGSSATSHRVVTSITQTWLKPHESSELLLSFNSFGNYALSLDHEEDLSIFVGDLKATSIIARHDRTLDNDGEFMTKLLSIIAIDNPGKASSVFTSLTNLFVNHAI
jgi:hypothetical protein